MNYLIIGSGRLAIHLQCYFNLLGISFKTWSKKEELKKEKLDSNAFASLYEKINRSSHILLAISDDAISDFYSTHLKVRAFQKTVIHFSGALEHPEIFSAHPLMSFTNELYSLDLYKKIHFVMSRKSLNELIPELPNTFTLISPELKPFYHSLCVLGGNFPTLLITKMLSEFANMNIPQSAAQVYLEQILINIFKDPARALTGPLIRKDYITINKNLNSLQSDPFEAIYKAFVKAYIKSNDKGESCEHIGLC